jgi:excisionase family DNA binding protein
MPSKRPNDRDVAISTEEIRAAFADEASNTAFPPILSVQQAARLMQVPVGTIYDWSSRGLLRHCSKKIGKHLRILRDRFVQNAFTKGVRQDGSR